MDSAALWKWGSLGVFCLQNSFNPIMFRLATTETDSALRASTSAILLFQEVTKAVASLFLLLAETGGSVPETASIIWEDALKKPKESIHLAIPAVIYALQNALLQMSAAHLSAAVWQVSYQGKTLVTAFFSVVLLRKHIARAQWLAIAIMGAGIATVELSDSKESKQSSMGNANEQSVQKGLVMILLACFCSGFASVYTELLFKQVGHASGQKKKSVWLQNMQLAMFSIVITSFSFVFELCWPGAAHATRPVTLLGGFTKTTWLMVFNNAFGGLLVALVIKHADNILRGFASSFATINCAIISVFMFGFSLGFAFGVGALMVIASTLLYGGVVKIPGDWWNSECELCVASAGDEPKYSAVASVELPATTAPGVNVSSEAPNINSAAGSETTATASTIGQATA
mmetsp:Transcript_48623/g.87364  ORF Transcript_48623/g.87364 Transcript_48623/m.87364 type:complete len:402 (-) Transcript_48623:43-1248(-)